MKAEIIDGVRVPGWKITWWVYSDRVRYGLSKRRERMWMAIAWHAPRELKRWVLVNAACKVWTGENINPDLITYQKMCETLDTHVPA